MKVSLKVILLNLALLALLYTGVILGMTGPGNILTFLSWVAGIGFIVLLFTSDMGLKPVGPKGLTLSILLIAVMVTAWYGWFIEAGLWFIQLSIYNHLVDKYKKNQEDINFNKTIGSTVQTTSPRP